MNPMMMELLPLVHQGYCCSQLLLLLMLQAQDRQNPGVVRAAQGLCHGIGQSDGPCGLLTGGACALALAAGKGAEDEIPHPMLTPMLNDYASWFYDRTEGYGGLIYETVNANSLSAFVREQISENDDVLPDWLEGLVSVFEKTTVGVHKAPRK